jgi:hypothetical protein
MFDNDELFEAFKKKDEAWTRSQLDARGTDASPATFEEMASNKFNDKTWIPTSIKGKIGHDNFRHSRPLKLSDGRHVTPDGVRKYLTKASCKLARVKSEYDISGNGAWSKEIR